VNDSFKIQRYAFMVQTEFEVGVGKSIHVVGKPDLKMVIDRIRIGPADIPENMFRVSNMRINGHAVEFDDCITELPRILYGQRGVLTEFDCIIGYDGRYYPYSSPFRVNIIFHGTECTEPTTLEEIDLIAQIHSK
jgi:hypothetical protein